jgi:hypothetical protein
MALIVGGVTVTGTQTLDATKLTGTLPALNGSSLTNLPSSAPSSSQVFSAIASGMGTNVVGTYGCMRIIADIGIGGNDATPGTNVAGSKLKYCNVKGDISGSVTPSGTYKLMGRAENHNQQSAEQRASVFVRIS